MPDDDQPGDMPGDGQDQPPEETEVTCAGGITIPPVGAGDGE